VAASRSRAMKREIMGRGRMHFNLELAVAKYREDL
jgi:hypothetical protein